MAVIVVGIDASDESKEALHWALEEARLRRATLRAVHAWIYPDIFGVESIPPEVLDRTFLHTDAKEMLGAVVAEVAGEDPQVRVEQIVAEGPPAHVLTEASKDADLLVVGSRGHGGFASLLLGSVSQQVAHHAHCTVVIVRLERPTA